MNIESQCCSLELAKKLKELEVKQESYFLWGRFPDDSFTELKYEICSSRIKFNEEEIYSAFTVAELLDLIPRIIDTKENEPFNIFRFNLKKSFVAEGSIPNLIVKTQYLPNFECDSTELEGQDAWLRRTLTGYSKFADEKCADSLAKILIYLLENGLMKNE